MTWQAPASESTVNALFQPNAVCDWCGAAVELIGTTALDQHDRAGDDKHQHSSGVGPIRQRNGNWLNT